jgi:hypothetical protein
MLDLTSWKDRTSLLRGSPQARRPSRTEKPAAQTTIALRQGGPPAPHEAPTPFQTSRFLQIGGQLGLSRAVQPARNRLPRGKRLFWD